MTVYRDIDKHSPRLADKDRWIWPHLHRKLYKYVLTRICMFTLYRLIHLLERLIRSLARRSSNWAVQRLRFRETSEFLGQYLTLVLVQQFYQWAALRYWSPLCSLHSAARPTDHALLAIRSARTRWAELSCDHTRAGINVRAQRARYFICACYLR